MDCKPEEPCLTTRNHCLVLVEHEQQIVHPSIRRVITAARALSKKIVLLVVGEHCQPLVEQIVCIDGVDAVWVAQNSCYTHASAEQWSALINALSDEWTYVLAASTSFGKNILPRVAACQDVAQVSDVMAIKDHETFSHPLYSGEWIETVRVLDEKKILTIRAQAFAPAADQRTPCPIRSIEHAIPSTHTRWVDAHVETSTRPVLAQAERVVSGGRGLQNAQNFKMIERLADVLGASVGATRAAVDAGFISNTHQVGQTGQTVCPQLYIAVGISGAIQHIAGMKDAQVIVAINQDEHAPIFHLAHYGLVGDLFEIVPQLIEKLELTQIKKRR